ncbi:MAG: outer rane efflux protein [Myxococcaceae bacterium]|nr:outer rane efflux protein [Myxococcaceae bacterium]
MRALVPRSAALWLSVLCLLLVRPASAQDDAGRVPDLDPARSAGGKLLTLAAALEKGRANNPTLRGQVAQGQAIDAQQDKALSALLPTLTGNASYARTTSNFVQRPGYSGGGGNSATTDLVITNADGTATLATATSKPRAQSTNYNPALFNTFNFGLTANVLLYDFNTTIDRYRSAKETTKGYEERTRAAALTVDFNVRDSFLRARAQKALIAVAKQTVENNQRHVDQIQAFVDAGTRPEIDLLQVRTDLANARVALLQAENAYAVAKVTLQRNMGVEEELDFEISDEQVPVVDGEARRLDELLRQAMHDRPDVTALVRDLRAAELNVGAAKGGYGPALNGSAAITRQGIELGNLATNWQVGAQASWQFLSGGYTRADVHQARANVSRAEASIAELRSTVRLQVAQAQINLQTALAQLDAAGEALTNARGRMALAEGRYEAGVGNIIELGDAQIALTQAESQRIQSEYNISLARAQLISALGATR